MTRPHENDANEALRFVIGASLCGQRLDQALAHASGLSRARIQKLIRDRAVTLDGAPPARASIRVKTGAVIVVRLPETQPLDLAPEDIPLDILHEDEHLLVVNKPAGMVVHPAHGHDRGTLVHALLHHCPNLPGINGVERPGIVHRLDKDTSGSLVVAKTEQAHRALTRMFAAHDLDREYVAWCRSAPPWRETLIEASIGRHPHHRQKMSVRVDGKPAQTRARVERRYGDAFSRLRLVLYTGRTHQIRVHLSHLGYPVLGDTTYGRAFRPGRDVPEPARGAIIQLARQALHAGLLRFRHPVSGNIVECVAPWPEDLQRLSDALERSWS